MTRSMSQTCRPVKDLRSRTDCCIHGLSVVITAKISVDKSECRDWGRDGCRKWDVRY